MSAEEKSLALRCRSADGFRWHDGMRIGEGTHAGFRVELSMILGEWGCETEPQADYEDLEPDDLPDLDDPATLGCLRHLCEWRHGPSFMTHTHVHDDGTPSLFSAYVAGWVLVADGYTLAECLVACLEVEPRVREIDEAAGTLLDDLNLKLTERPVDERLARTRRILRGSATIDSDARTLLVNVRAALAVLAPSLPDQPCPTPKQFEEVEAATLAALDAWSRQATEDGTVIKLDEDTADFVVEVVMAEVERQARRLGWLGPVTARGASS